MGRKRTRFFGVRCTPEDLQILKGIAEQRQCSIGAVIRSAVIHMVKDTQEGPGPAATEAGAPVALQA